MVIILYFLDIQHGILFECCFSLLDRYLRFAEYVCSYYGLRVRS